jgi:hypothetical protein
VELEEAEFAQVLLVQQHAAQGHGTVSAAHLE